MIYEVVWDSKAVDELDKLDSSVARRIAKKVEELRENLLSQDIKKLKGSSDFRLRVGDYRVIFEIDGSKIKILKLGHRQNIYDG